MTNKCDCRQMFYCTSTDPDDCRYSSGQRHKAGTCLFIDQAGDVLICTNRDAQLAALIKRKGEIVR